MSKYKINSAIDVSGIKRSSNRGEVSKPILFDEYSSELKKMAEGFGFAADLKAAKDYRSVAAYATIYTRVSGQLKEVIKAVDEAKHFYLVEVILSQIVDDALSPTMGSEEIVKFSCNDKTIQKELDSLKKRINLDQLIENIAPELLAYGEYTLSTKFDVSENGENKKSNGLADITDTVEQGTVISLTQDGRTEAYLAIDQSGTIHLRQLADYIKFQMGGHKIKANIDQFIPYNKKFKEKFTDLPRFIRVGKSILFPILEKLKELEILEKLIPASKINEISKGNLVGMSLPENYSLDDALKAIKRIEGLINKTATVDPDLKRITVESILSVAGKTKIIPTFGDKGNLQNMDYKNAEVSGLTSDAKELRTLILDSAGIPVELVFSSDGATKSEILKRYAKYLRKLKRFQRAIAEGCKQIAFIHLVNKNISFKEDDIQIVFNNNLVEIDNLDKLEHADITTSLLKNVRDFFGEMIEESSPYRETVNLNKVTEYMEQNLRTIGLADAMNTQKEGGPSVEPKKEETTDDVDLDGINDEEPSLEPEKEEDEIS